MMGKIAPFPHSRRRSWSLMEPLSSQDQLSKWVKSSVLSPCRSKNLFLVDTVCTIMTRLWVISGKQVWTTHVPSFHVVGGPELKGRGPTFGWVLVYWVSWFGSVLVWLQLASGKQLWATQAPSFHVVLYKMYKGPHSIECWITVYALV